jgi:hypothetical protein
MFKIGEVVVCVNSSNDVRNQHAWLPRNISQRTLPSELLKKGELYTIRGLHHRCAAVYLEEIVREEGALYGGGSEYEEVPFAWLRFERPKKSQVEIVEKLLIPVKETEDA